MASKVYFCDFRTHTDGMTIPQKLQKLLRRDRLRE